MRAFGTCVFLTSAVLVVGCEQDAGSAGAAASKESAVDLDLVKAAEQIAAAIRARSWEVLKPHVDPELHELGPRDFRQLLEAIEDDNLDPAKAKVHKVIRDPGLTNVIKSATLVLEFDGQLRETTMSVIGGKVTGTAAWIRPYKPKAAKAAAP